VADVVGSAREGVDMSRQSMLTVLDQHQVVPIAAQGQPFDPSQMHTLAQQPGASVPPNTVIQEVVRGYRWQDRLLREAQVIVAAGPATAPPAEHYPAGWAENYARRRACSLTFVLIATNSLYGRDSWETLSALI